MKLAVADVTFALVEVGGHQFHSSRVAYEDDSVGELFRFHMQMEDASVGVDDEF